MSTLYRRRTEARSVGTLTIACWVATAYLIWRLYMMETG